MFAIPPNTITKRMLNAGSSCSISEFVKAVSEDILRYFNPQGMLIIMLSDKGTYQHCLNSNTVQGT